MSCRCTNYNLCIAQGATFSKTFLWNSGPCCGQGTAGASSQPVDLTGYTANMQIKAYALATSALYDASGDITLGGPAGTVTLTIPASATETFTWWQGVYDMLLTDPSGNVTRFLSGSVTVCPGVTP
jgi:hypothetical protein